MFVVEPATLIAFDGAGYTATVRYASSLTHAVGGVPVSRVIDATELIAGRRLVIAIFDDGPADAMILGVW